MGLAGPFIKDSQPKLAARLAMNIAAGLSQVDPDDATIFAKNAQQYADNLNLMADDFAALGKTVKNNRIITQHGVFDYLARNMGLEVCAVVQAHAAQEPSAAGMLEIIQTEKEKKVTAVFTEPPVSSPGRTDDRQGIRYFNGHAGPGCDRT